MSRVVSNYNMQKVENIKTSSASSLLATACGAAIAGVTSFAINELFTGDVNLSTSKIKKRDPSIIKSTQSCREELASFFTNNFQMQTSSSKMMTNYKSAFINSLRCSSFQIEDPKSIKENIKGVLISATIKELKKKADDLVLKIEQQHANILKNELDAKIKEASCEIGFSNIKIIQDKRDCTIFTCENNDGQALVHEMHIDQKTNQIDHIYEYVDNKDRVCASENDICEITANKFQKALENKGVYFSTSQKKPTGGNVVLPFSKEVKKQLAQEGKNMATKRARALNRKRNTIKI